MRPPRTRYLETSSADRSLRWAYERGLSVRAYEVLEQTCPWFCVPQRKAELVYVVEGELWLEMGPARQHLRLGPSMAAIILRGTPHHIHHSASRTKTLVIDVSDEVLDLVQIPRSLGLVEVSREAFRGRRDDLCGEVYETLTERTGDSLRDSLVTVFHRSLPNKIHTFEPSHSTRKMLEVKARLDSGFMSSFELADLAHDARVNRFYLVRAFKQNFGVPPLAYVQFLRLDRFVRTMLRQADRSLSDLAGESGFGDYSTFSRRVRQRLGKAPSQLVIR